MTDPGETQRAAERRRAAPAGSGEPAGAGTPGGLLGTVRAHPTAWLASVLAVVFVLLGTGAVFAGVAAGTLPAPTPTPTPTVTPEPPRPTPSAVPEASRLRTCSVDDLAKDPRLADFQGYVLRADTGEALFDRKGTVPARTGSVLKILTAAAALAELGPDYQLRTRVMAGPTPGSIVLVGGGDATITRLGPGQESFYRGAPKLGDLAAQAVSAWAAANPGQPITQVLLDAGYWDPADRWDPAWKRSEQEIGYHSEVTALQVDADRSDPTRSTSPRSTDPIGRAGQFFVDALRQADTGGVIAGDLAVTTGAAPADAAQLAEVRSQPVRSLIQQMLLVSDNTIAEMLARVTSKAMGLDGSAASLQQAIPGALEAYGVDTSGLVIKDGSGLSEFNNVAPSYVAELMVKVISGEQHLNLLYDGLPVAGQSGSLAARFTGENGVARGNVVAKTGWIDTAYSLGGVINAKDGVRLTFAFYAIGNVREDAKLALDTLATGVYSCGDNLSNL
ncbi:D-alanyl-D-alanine carboxypeptidase/D-alanyl-D-alanine-endopeptidase [Lysobacter korlensis]|uniref:D-alanyl-D-alanine carboxypeptidase/D-alanyl-D-alanine-endopeptidase n=1 Tax=Lysobacter korlensis TaxID=553636 RepID=A0ABV6RZU3_9GAMM